MQLASKSSENLLQGLIDAADAMGKPHLLREKSKQLLTKLGIPRGKEEAFHYVPLQKLTFPQPFIKRQPFTKALLEPHLLPECRSSRVVFVDGYYEESLSDLSAIPAACVCLSLEDALRSYSVFLKNRMTRTVKEEKDPFVALSGLFSPQGAFLYVPAQIEMMPPIQIIHIVTQPLIAALRLQIFVGARSSVRLIHTSVVQNDHALVTEWLDLDLDREARVDCYSLLQSSEDSVLFHALRSSLKRQAELKAFFCTRGSALTRMSAQIVLQEEQAQASLKGLWQLRQESQSHAQVKVEHRAPHCKSCQHFKGVLREKSRSSFAGEIHVYSEAQKTEAYQLNQNLLLSDEAQAYAKPNLKIFADDVKASHGATFGQLNTEELFYLQSRGLARQEAEKILLEGFCREILDTISFEPLKKVLYARGLT